MIYGKVKNMRNQNWLLKKIPLSATGYNKIIEKLPNDNGIYLNSKHVLLSQILIVRSMLNRFGR